MLANLRLNFTYFGCIMFQLGPPLHTIHSLCPGHNKNYYYSSIYFNKVFNKLCRKEDLKDILLKEKAKMIGFYPTNESEDCWPAMHSYNFIIRVK